LRLDRVWKTTCVLNLSEAALDEPRQERQRSQRKYSILSIEEGGGGGGSGGGDGQNERVEIVVPARKLRSAVGLMVPLSNLRLVAYSREGQNSRKFTPKANQATPEGFTLTLTVAGR